MHKVGDNDFLANLKNMNTHIIAAKLNGNGMKYATIRLLLINLYTYVAIHAIF